MLAALQERVVSLERELSAVKSQLQRDYKWKSYMESLILEFFGRDVSREMQQKYGGANDESEFLRRKNVPVPKTFLGSRIEDIILPGNRSYGNGKEPNDNVKRTRYESDYQNQAQSSPANLQYTSLSSDGGNRMDGNFTSGGWADTSQGMQSNWNSGNNQNSFNSTGNSSDQGRYNTNRNLGNSTAVSSEPRRREQYRQTDFPSVKATPLMHANDMSMKQFSNTSNSQNYDYEFEPRARRPAVGSDVVVRDRSGEYDGGSFYPSSGRSQTAHVTSGSSHYIPPLMQADSFPPPVVKRARPSGARGSTPINSQSNRQQQSNNFAESANSREDRRLAKRLIHQQRMFDKYGFRSGPELHAAIEAEKRAEGDYSFTMTESVASENSAADGGNFPLGRRRPHRGGRNRGRRGRNFPSTGAATETTNEAEDNDTESADNVKSLVDVDYSDDINMESFPGNGPQDSAAGESND